MIKWVPNPRFQHPSALLISGTTGAGKSYFVKNLIEQEGIEGDIKHIYYFMPRLENLDIQPLPHQQLYLMEGLPTRNWVDDMFKKENKNCMIIIDDMWSKCVEDPVIENLLTYGRRHFNVSLVFIAQNFYEKSRKAITLR